MSTNLPTINEARAIAKKHSLPSLIFLFMTNEGRQGYVSYGRNPRLCDATRKFADTVFEFIEKYGNPRKKDEALSELLSIIAEWRYYHDL